MKSNKVDISLMMESFERVCRAKGLRITHQRIEIFKALLKHTNHPTIEDVFDRVRRHLKTISLDTVYRTISTFEEYGLIRRVHHVDSATRLDVNISDHHHLVCKKCNEIEDFYWPDFDRLKPPKSISHWDQIEFKHVVMSGLCSNCKKGKR
jgi:Fur family peroxide stress response transcriptional regulator